MQMTMRWFGTKYDTVTLEQIRQVPGVTGIITTLYGKLPGEVWEKAAIAALKAEAEASGLGIAGIESVNIHDAIKTGAPDRDKYIDHYITTLERLGEADIHLVCYNFMPVFDWTRTELAKLRKDGSATMAYDQSVIDTIDPNDLSGLVERQSKGFVLAGWEPERLSKLKELFAM
ncbi:MAG: mannonate dehydratase, partial [Treponema sp.]|nr:mannonate dehydratase [Treponema sp.]